jgi:hypothetical protein
MKRKKEMDIKNGPFVYAAASGIKHRGVFLGIVLWNDRLCYGYRCGLRLPSPLSRGIVIAWNHIACRILGHDDFEAELHAIGELGRLPHCTACGVHLPVSAPC